MGKLEREAKQVTAGILEVGRRFGFWEDWQMKGGILSGEGGFSLGLFFMQLLSLLLIFFRCASIMLSGCVIF